LDEVIDSQVDAGGRRSLRVVGGGELRAGVTVQPNEKR
jgi:hypothetical protein